jgi:proteic killer suppression protein
MEVSFEDDELDRLEVGPGSGKFCQAIIKAYRRRIQQIRDATSLQDFYPLKSLHFEKLRGDRIGEWSMRLNDQWRLIMRIDESGVQVAIVICGIEDYHH